MRSIRQFVVYLYLLRFSLLLWLLPLILLLVDHFATSAFTRGIFLPVRCLSYLVNTFFLVSNGALSLVTARIVVRNGNDRFDVEAPAFFWKLLGGHGGNKNKWALLALFLSQISTLVSFFWIRTLAERQGISASAIWLGSLFGLLLAAFFWFVVNCVYIVLYDAEAYRPYNSGACPKKDEKDPDPAPIMLLPNWKFLNSIQGKKFQPGFMARKLLSLLSTLARIGGPGYVCERTNGKKGVSGAILWEGHIFATITFFALLVIYLLQWILAAPLRLSYGGNIAIASVVIAFFVGFGMARRRDVGRLEIICCRLCFGVLLAVIPIIITLLYSFFDAQRFPVFAEVLLLFNLLLSLAAGAAFLLDRSRLPVLEVVVGIFLILNMAYHPKSNDRYITLRERSTPAPALRSPADFIRNRAPEAFDSAKSEPIIIVTATGGGIHAAAWTAQILGELEEQSQQDFHGSYNFHDHLVLLSTVSGGSAGALSFLHEYTANDPFAHPRQATKRMFESASCSSLEAVA